VVFIHTIVHCTRRSYVQLGIVDGIIAEREVAVVERDNAVTERDAAVAERDAAQHVGARTEMDRDRVAAERDAAVAERDRVAAIAAAAIAERDRAVTDSEALVVERNAAYTERDRAVAERDAYNAERDAIAAERDRAVADNEGLAAELTVAWETLEREVRRLRAKQRAGSGGDGAVDDVAVVAPGDADYAAGIDALEWRNGVAKDAVRARRLLEEAAGRGHARAQGELGRMLKSGLGGRITCARQRACCSLQ
jgi:hypothetical protein